MQATRQRILGLLRDHRVSTVDELAAALALTPVTVRHHLDILKAEGLVESPEVRHRDTPGRPQYTFRLTEAALAHFPKNYQAFAHLMVSEIREQLPEEDMERILAGVASRMAAEAAREAAREAAQEAAQEAAREAALPEAGAPMERRLEAAVRYLNARGYDASWEHTQDGQFVLRTRNCPYHELSHAHGEFCTLDLALVSQLLGAQTAVEDRISAGGASCSYVLTAPGA